MRLSLLLAICLLSYSLPAPIPEWFALQGRLSVARETFDGWGEFKISLLSGREAPQLIWHHDGTDPAADRPATALRVWVTNGLFVIPLGDTTLSNMAPLPGRLETWTPLHVRLWFNDGTHGWEQLSPDIAIGAVPFALHAAQWPTQSITWDHLAPELQTRLLSTNPPASLYENQLLLAPWQQATNLLQQGFVPFPLQFAQTAWQTDYLDPRLTPAFLAAPGTNVWDGAHLWLWRWPQENQPGQGARYETATGRWHILSSANAPVANPQRAWLLPCRGDLILLEAGPENWRAFRHRREANTWEDASFTLPMPWPARVIVLDLPAGPVVLATTENQLSGGWFDPAQNQWQPLETNDAPALDWSTTRFAPLTNGWLALGWTENQPQLWHYQLSPALWRRLNTDGFSLPWQDALQTVWTGAEWYWLEARPEGWRGARYLAAGDQWLELPTTNAPLPHAETQCLWNGRELMLVNLAAPPPPGVFYSARLDLAAHRWQPMNPAAPVSLLAPRPVLLPLPEALLMTRISDPTSYALYDYAADRWQPLAGPNLGFQALVQWTGAEVLALPYQPPPEEPLYLHRYLPPQRVGVFYRPTP